MYPIGNSLFNYQQGIWENVDSVTDNKVLVDSVCGSLAIEGMVVPESIRSLMLECANGTMSYDDAVNEIMSRYDRGEYVGV